MRRMLASLLLVLFGFPPIAPALLANTVSGLPACCLRNGKHHCAVAEVDAGSSLRANQPKCPLFPKTPALGTFATSLLFGTPQQASAPHLSGSAVTTPEEHLVHISLDNSARMRGPPNCLLGPKIFF
jgi:hypothetical protein